VIADGLDVGDRAVLAARVARERRTPGNVERDVLGEVAECGVPVAALGGGQVVGHQLTWGHAETVFRIDVL
jgi:hypothetical protein